MGVTTGSWTVFLLRAAKRRLGLLAVPTQESSGTPRLVWNQTQTTTCRATKSGFCLLCSDTTLSVVQHNNMTHRTTNHFILYFFPLFLLSSFSSSSKYRTV